MRVLHLVKTSIGATWALEQMRVQRAMGLDVHVMLPNDGPMAANYRAAGIGVDFQPHTLTELICRPGVLRNRLHEALDRIRPDLLHSHFVQTTLAARALLGRNSKLPRVFQIAGPLHLENPVTRFLDVESAGPIDYWVAACELSKRLLVNAGVHSTKVTLAYHGIDPSRFHARVGGKLRRELGLQGDVPIVGMVAYMYSPKRFLGQTRGLKGHEDLIDAIASLEPPLHRAVGVFVGGAWGEQAKSYEAKVREYGERKLGQRAVFLGTRNDVLELYPDIDVAVHPSHSENLGGAVESMMMARPTIATSIGGFPDIVIDNETGWLVPPKNSQALAAAITRVLSDRSTAQAVAENGRTLVASKLDIQTQTRKLVDYYQAILDTNRR